VGELKDVAAKARDAVRAALKPEYLWQEAGPNPRLKVEPVAQAEAAQAPTEG
jgi:hypothetical protein